MDLSKVINFAADAHADQQYGSKPYVYHLTKVAQVAKEYGGDNYALALAFLHDIIEDTHYTESDIAKEFGAPIASLVSLLTNQSSKEKTFARIRENKLAVFIKLCDRIANLREGKFSKYKKEYPLFKQILYKKGEFEKMWKELDELLK